MGSQPKHVSKIPNFLFFRLEKIFVDCISVQSKQYVQKARFLC